MLIGCSNDESSQNEITPQDIDFTGVWSYEAVEDTYITSTDEQVYTTHRSSLVIMNDLPTGVRYNECVLDESSGGYSIGVKTDKNFYMGDFDNGFKVLTSTALNRERAYDLTYIDNRYVREIATLRKIADVPRANQGTVTLSGGGFLNENTDEVCIIRSRHPSDIEGTIYISIPYNGALLYIRMDYSNGMAEGSFTQTNDRNDIVELSLSTAYFDAISTNFITPSSGTLTISMYNDQAMEGEFSFTDIDQINYIGTFSVTFQ
ncbi:hypothetical protein [Kaarinaea lacus]